MRFRGRWADYSGERDSECQDDARSCADLAGCPRKIHARDALHMDILRCGRSRSSGTISEA